MSADHGRRDFLRMPVFRVEGIDKDQPLPRGIEMIGEHFWLKCESGGLPQHIEGKAIVKKSPGVIELVAARGTTDGDPNSHGRGRLKPQRPGRNQGDRS